MIAAIDDRKTKAEVSYQATPIRRMRCLICANYTAPNGCRKVRGYIGSDGWCEMYKSRRQPK